MAALENCNPHQSRFDGRERVYRIVATRWRKWMVRAKSGTNLDRETKIRRKITLDTTIVQSASVSDFTSLTGLQ